METPDWELDFLDEEFDEVVWNSYPWETDEQDDDYYEEEWYVGTD